MTARWDLSDVTPESGDQLRLDLPPEFTLDVADFPLVVDDETTLGTCSTTPISGDQSAFLTCTLDNDDYLAEHDQIWASVEASVQAWEQTDEESVLFYVDGELIPVRLPGGIGTPGLTPKPNVVAKDGWFNSQRTEAMWRVFIPGSLVQDADPVTITDALPTGLSYREDSLRIVSIPDTEQGWADFIVNDGSPVASDTFDASFVDGTLTVELSDVDPERLYVLRFATPLENPSATAVGDAFTNTVFVEDHRSTTSAELADRASGAGGGELRPTEPEPTEPEPTEPEPTETAPTESEPTESEPTESAPEPTEPTEPEPTEPEPTEPDSSESASANTSTPPAADQEESEPSESPESSSSAVADTTADSSETTDAANVTDSAASGEKTQSTLAATGSSGIVMSVLGALALLILGLVLITRQRSRQHS